MNNVDILHITPHLGGGVGQVLLNYFAFDKINNHTVVTLDYANEKALKIAEKAEFRIFSDMHKRTDQILKFFSNADLVVVHFWNHPFLYDFLIRNSLPAARIVFWAHISGLEAPYVFSEKILDYPDKFIFTTPLSFNTKEVHAFPNKSKLEVVFSTGGIEHVKNITPQVHMGFNIGYIGTVDYAKMHPRYVEIHKQIKIKDAKFIIVGGDNEKEISKTSDARFEFTGKVTDICPYLEQFDVFGYLLNEKHYGTAEQVLQEAMAAGVVPVVLNNPAESLLVKHGETGFVAKDVVEYQKYIELLYRNRKLKEQLSKNAKRYALGAFSLENMTLKWNDIYQEMLNIPKRERGYSRSPDIKPIDVFLESLGDYRKPFVTYLKTNDATLLKETLRLPQWRSDTKGTPKQYYSFFPGDKELKRICEYYEK